MIDNRMTLPERQPFRHPGRFRDDFGIKCEVFASTVGGEALFRRRVAKHLRRARAEGKAGRGSLALQLMLHAIAGARATTSSAGTRGSRADFYNRRKKNPNSSREAHSALQLFSLHGGGPPVLVLESNHEKYLQRFVADVPFNGR